MEQSQLVDLVRKLSPDEKAKVKKIVELGYFCHAKTQPFVKKILDYIINYSFDGSTFALDKSKVYTHIFPGHEFIPGKLEKIMVEAHKVLKSFLLLEHYFSPQNEFLQEYDFLKILNERGAIDRYDTHLSKLKREADKMPSASPEILYRKYSIEKEIHNFETVKNRVRGDLNIPPLLHSLELFFYTSKLEYICFFLLQKKAASLTTPPRVEEMLNSIAIPKYYLDEFPVLNIYSKIYNILNKGRQEVEDIQTLYKLLQKHEQELDDESLRTFYSYLRNFCVLASSLFFDNEEVKEILHELYKDNLPRGFLHYEGKLHPNTYLAVTISGLRVNEFKWVFEFIEKYKSELFEVGETDDYYRLNKAYYLFYTGQFSQSLDLIPPTFTNSQYLLHAKRLELMNHFEIQSELLTYKLDTFKMFISRTSSKLLSERLRQINSDFANLLHQIVYSTPGDVKRSELLVKRVHERKQAAEWRWLLEKAQELRHR